MMAALVAGEGEQRQTSNLRGLEKMPEPVLPNGKGKGKGKVSKVDGDGPPGALLPVEVIEQ